MRAGSFRKYFATHNPVRLFPEELKRTRSNIVTDAKSINDFEAESPASSVSLSRLSGLKINVCAYTL